MPDRDVQTSSARCKLLSCIAITSVRCAGRGPSLCAAQTACTGHRHRPDHVPPMVASPADYVHPLNAACRGHNELDEPAFTQPAMYNHIRSRKSVPQLYEDKLLVRLVSLSDRRNCAYIACLGRRRADRRGRRGDAPDGARSFGRAACRDARVQAKGGHARGEMVLVCLACIARGAALAGHRRRDGRSAERRQG